MPPLLADFSHARACKPFCEKYLTLPHTREECEEKLKVLIVEMKAEIAEIKAGEKATNKG